MMESKAPDGGIAALLSAKSVGRRLRSYRLARGIEIQDFAEAIGEDRNQISQWETGRSRPSIPAAYKISEAWGIPADYLFFGKMGLIPDDLVAPVSAHLRRLELEAALKSSSRDRSAQAK